MNRRDFMKVFAFSLGGAALSVPGMKDKEVQAEKLKEIEPSLPMNFKFQIGKNGECKLIEEKTGEVIGGIVKINWGIEPKGFIKCQMDVEFHVTSDDVLPWFRRS